MNLIMDIINDLDPDRKVAEISTEGNALVIVMNNLTELDTIDDDEFVIQKDMVAEIKKQKTGGVRIFFKHRPATVYHALMVEGFADDQALYDFLKPIVTGV